MNDFIEVIDYKYDQPSDRWWRRFGLWIYAAGCGLAIAVVPAATDAPTWLVRAIDWVPALGGLLKASNSDGRVIAWVVSSALLYPVMHLYMRAHSRRELPATFLKMLIATIILDLIVLMPLSFDVMSVAGNRATRLIRAVFLSDGLAMIVVAPVLSIGYAAILFVNIQNMVIAPFESYRDR